MSNSAQIILNIEKYRAISQATINIDGITVVAGENGCGKSTISKILYYLFKISSSYNLLVAENLKNELDSVLRLMNIAIRDLSSQHKLIRNQYLTDLQKLEISFSNEEPNQILLDALISQLKRLKLTLTTQESSTTSNRRLVYMFEDVLKDKTVDGESISALFDRIIQKVEHVFQSTFRLINSRNSFLVKNELENIFHTETLPEKLELFEFDQEIFSLKSERLAVPYSIQNTLYIDTPMILGEYSDINQHWNELNKLISSNKYKTNNKLLTDMISKEILKGDVDYEDSVLASNNFSFKRNTDNKIFNLLDCATGIKSFAILQFLLKLGFINDKTLLVFDEPESNLHPQWIVEYARIIVLISKHIKAKIFIATHNPDFVSAIRYISEKEGILDKINFYLATQNENMRYHYENLGKEIEPIFSSFNIALDRIEKYGI